MPRDVVTRPISGRFFHTMGTAMFLSPSFSYFFNPADVFTQLQTHVISISTRWTPQDWHQTKSVTISARQDYEHKNENRQASKVHAGPPP